MMKYKFLLVPIIAFVLVNCTDNEPKPASGVEIIKGQRNTSKRSIPQGFEKFDDNEIFIRVERKGKGEKLAKDDVVTIHYKEWLLPKRKKINDSYEIRSPKSFRLGNGQMIEGIERVLLEQRVGAVFQVQIPWQLGYGDKVVYDYPPKSDVVMDVTVLGKKDSSPLNDTLGISPITLNSGIKIYHLSHGKGNSSAKVGDGVEVHYQGYYADGRIFDSSLDRGRPIRFQLGSGQVISGWEEIVATMKQGDIVTAYIPYYKAYGETGRGKIPPSTDLYFDMELVAINRQE